MTNKKEKLTIDEVIASMSIDELDAMIDEAEPV